MDGGRAAVAAAASASLGRGETYGHLCPACRASWVRCLSVHLSLVVAVSRFLERGQKQQEKGIKMIKTMCLSAAPGFLSVIRE